MLIGDMLEDLGEYHVDDIAEATRETRRDANQKFFPTSGELRKRAEAAAKNRREREEFGARPDKFDSRPLAWWFIPRARWKPHWRESQIPEDWREVVRKLEAKRNAE